MTQRTPLLPTGKLAAWALTVGALISSCGAASENVASNAASSATGSPSDANLHFVGRIDLSTPLAPAFQWSGTGVLANFEGTSLGISLEDNGNQFTVVLDGTVLPTLVTQTGVGRYDLASDLSTGAHRIEVYRQTEASFGPTQFLGFDFGEDGRSLPPQLPERHIEVIGDSVSTAYGVLGESTACGFSADTQDHYQSYVSISARELNAELSTVAWSGKGIVYNYDEDRIDPMPSLYDRILPDSATSLWDYSALEADAVLINLGTNDFSTDNDPIPELFAEEYRKLLVRVRTNYPDAYILCTVGPMLNGADLDAARVGITTAVSQFEDAGGTQVGVWEMTTPNASPGCDYHPSVSTHQAMSEGLTQQLRSALNW